MVNLPEKCYSLYLAYLKIFKKKIFTRESDITKERIQKILATGANVILTTGGIDDLCLKYFVEAGAMAVRRVKKVDLKRIAKATGGMFSFVSLCTFFCPRKMNNRGLVLF